MSTSKKRENWKLDEQPFNEISDFSKIVNNESHSKLPKENIEDSSFNMTDNKINSNNSKSNTAKKKIVKERSQSSIKKPHPK